MLNLLQIRSALLKKENAEFDPNRKKIYHLETFASFKTTCKISTSQS